LVQPLAIKGTIENSCSSQSELESRIHQSNQGFQDLCIHGSYTGTLEQSVIQLGKRFSRKGGKRKGSEEAIAPEIEVLEKSMV
jgi:hypothetical protein